MFVLHAASQSPGWTLNKKKRKKRLRQRTALFQLCDDQCMIFSLCAYFCHWFHLVFELCYSNFNIVIMSSASIENEFARKKMMRKKWSGKMWHTKKDWNKKKCREDLLWKKINGKMVFAYAHCTHFCILHMVLNYINAFWCKWTFFLVLFENKNPKKIVYGCNQSN